MEKVRGTMCPPKQGGSIFHHGMLGKGIVRHTLIPPVFHIHQTAGISQDLKDHTAHKGEGEGRSAAGYDISCNKPNQGDAKQGDEGGIGGQAESVHVKAGDIFAEGIVGVLEAEVLPVPVAFGGRRELRDLRHGSGSEEEGDGEKEGKQRTIRK